MLTAVVFGRKKQRGSKGPYADGDLFVSRVKEGGKSDREALSVRVHGNVMKRLRWIIGDFVTLRFGDESATQIILERVDGPKQSGMRLCANTSKTHAHGTVRFAADKAILDAIFGEVSSFPASFYEANGTSCVFLRD